MKVPFLADKGEVGCVRVTCPGDLDETTLRRAIGALETELEERNEFAGGEGE